VKIGSFDAILILAAPAERLALLPNDLGSRRADRDPAHVH
jgi:hypothetical protein